MDTSTKRPLAIVTGASSGIGYELGRQFAQHGFDLLVAAEDPGIVEAAQAFRQDGTSVDWLQVDLATYDGVETLYRKIQSLGKPVEAVAINAGVGVGGDFARQTDLATELNIIDLNVKSPVHLAKLASRDMVEQGHGRIMFTSSLASTMPAPFEAVYGASKAFLQSFSQALRNELKDTGVTVTSLMPGPTETEFFKKAGMEGTKIGAGKKDSAADVARDGYDALMAGKDHVVAGSFKNRMQAAAAKVIPEMVKAQIHRSKGEPGSAHE